MFILLLQDNFQCLIDIEGRQTKVSASVRQSRVICGETEYSYREARGETAAQLTVLWNRDTFIGRTNVTLYKCSLLGSHGGRGDCSLCASRDPKYECTWCSGHCTYGPTCNEPVQMTCPPPRIDWVSDRFRTCVEYLFGYWPTLGLQYLSDCFNSRVSCTQCYRSYEICVLLCGRAAYACPVYCLFRTSLAYK